MCQNDSTSFSSACWNRSVSQPGYTLTKVQTGGGHEPLPQASPHLLAILIANLPNNRLSAPVLQQQRLLSLSLRMKLRQICLILQARARRGSGMSNRKPQTKLKSSNSEQVSNSIWLMLIRIEQQVCVIHGLTH